MFGNKTQVLILSNSPLGTVGGRAGCVKPPTGTLVPLMS